jgi:hypothetical protein
MWNEVPLLKLRLEVPRKATSLGRDSNLKVQERDPLRVSATPTLKALGANRSSGTGALCNRRNNKCISGCVIRLPRCVSALSSGDPYSCSLNVKLPTNDQWKYRTLCPRNKWPKPLDFYGHIRCSPNKVSHIFIHDDLHYTLEIISLQYSAKMAIFEFRNVYFGKLITKRNK